MMMITMIIVFFVIMVAMPGAARPTPEVRAARALSTEPPTPGMP